VEFDKLDSLHPAEGDVAVARGKGMQKIGTGRRNRVVARVTAYRLRSRT